jgi:hypothetical protein
VHPYKKQPQYAFWSKAVVNLPIAKIDPFLEPNFHIKSSDKVATAGSCFAQHISRYLTKNGLNYYIAEFAHPVVKKELESKFGYLDFSARYGNIYTSRQLLQLFDRAFGYFSPEEKLWINEEGHWIDPFRPRIQPGGFRSKKELLADIKQHLELVKVMFKNLDFFIFTLGLTECWASKCDNAVFPLCPGVSGGEFDTKKYKFINLTAQEVKTDLVLFLEKLKKINSRARVILTVSPVPLVATAENQHVLPATVYSKSVLRVACEEVSLLYKNVSYFPSYEIITGNFSRGKYFGDDLRSVTEEGVAHVMNVFLKHFYGNKINKNKEQAINTNESFSKKMENLIKVNCDEIALEQTKTNRKI